MIKTKKKVKLNLKINPAWGKVRGEERGGETGMNRVWKEGKRGVTGEGQKVGGKDIEGGYRKY